jgi:hypothetical protein
MNETIRRKSFANFRFLSATGPVFSALKSLPKKKYQPFPQFLNPQFSGPQQSYCQDSKK